MTNFFTKPKVLLYTVLSAIIYIIGIIVHALYRGSLLENAIKEVTMMDVFMAIITGYIFGLIGELFYPLCYK